jgi:hypothetical protein
VWWEWVWLRLGGGGGTNFKIGLACLADGPLHHNLEHREHGIGEHRGCNQPIHDAPDVEGHTLPLFFSPCLSLHSSFPLLRGKKKRLKNERDMEERENVTGKLVLCERKEKGLT